MAWILASGRWDDTGTWEDGSNWLDGVATGGDVSQITVSGIKYSVHKFSASGTFVLHLPATVEYLIVGGGGPGGFRHAGGGGAGGVKSGSFSLTAGTYSVVVGAGGIASLVEATRGPNGGDSSFNGVTSLGGGAGGNNGQAGAAGASGGGGSNKGAGGAGTAGQGYNGGSTPSAFNYAVGGGGGGAGAVGGTATSTVSGVGGAGVSSSITGAAVVYGGGGGGGGDGQRGLGGSGGGGDGSLNATVATNGIDGLGGGGGGGGAAGASSGAGGNGGSGVVVLRYVIVESFDLSALPLIAGAAVLGVPNLSQKTPLVAVKLVGGIPVIQKPTLRTYKPWTIPVNWNEPVLEEVSFRTEIIKARDGSEQRIAQRVNPRYSFRWKSLVQRNQMRTAERALARNQAQEYAFEHPRAAILAERMHPASAGFFGRFDGEQSLRAVTDSVATLESRVDVSPGIYPGAFMLGYSYGAASLTHYGTEILPLRPNWASSPSINFEQTVENFGFERGVTDFYTPEEFTVRRIEMGFLIRNEEEEDLLRGLFYRARGRQGEFFVMDPLTSLELSGAFAGGTTLTFTGPEVYNTYGLEPTYRNVAVTSQSGTTFRRVTGVSLSGGNSVLTLDTALPASTILSVTWLLRCRFETDVLSLNWITDTLARAVINVRALEEAS